MERQVLEDDRGPALLRESHEPFRDVVETLPDTVPFPTTLAVKEDPLDPPVVGLLAGEPPPAAEVDRLDSTDAAEGERDESRGILLGDDAVH